MFPQQPTANHVYGKDAEAYFENFLTPIVNRYAIQHLFNHYQKSLSQARRDVDHALRHLQSAQKQLADAQLDYTHGKTRLTQLENNPTINHQSAQTIPQTPSSNLAT